MTAGRNGVGAALERRQEEDAGGWECRKHARMQQKGRGESIPSQAARQPDQAHAPVRGRETGGLP